MTMNLGALGQTCGLCGLPVGAPSGIVLPSGQSAATTCGGHSPEQALQIMFGRVAQLEQYVHVLMTEREQALEEMAKASGAVTVDIPDGIDGDALAEMIGEQILDEIQRNDT